MVCAIFQFLKINVIFGVLCCAVADWMEGGAENGCEVIWAEAVSCCREQFVEATKGKSSLFLQDLHLPGGGVLTASIPHICGKRKGKSGGNRFSIDFLCIYCVPYLPSLSNTFCN